MSDIPPLRPMDTYLQWKLSIESPSLAYAAKSVTKDVLFAVDIPYPLLKAWHCLVVLKKPIQTFCVASEDSESTSSLPKYAYTELLEFTIPGSSFAIRSDETVRSEVNNSLRIIAAKAYADYGRARGRKKKELDSKSKRFHLYDGQTVSVTDLKQENQLVRDQLEEWKKNCINLESDMKQIYHEMEMALKEKDEEISDLHSKNEELQNYIDLLEKSQNIQHKGKDISEVKKKSRTLKTFLSRAKVALWFAKSFGLELESMTVSETKSGVMHNLVAENNANTANAQGFDALSENDKSKVEKVLFLLDKFCVGDVFYHEMTMLVDGLPKSYLVKQRRDQLNKMCHITSTPGEEEGAQIPFKELLKERIKEYVTAHPSFISNGETLKVKISGDGARMTRSSNFILMSFAILQSSDDIMAAKGNHTVAVVKGKEDYDTLNKCFKDVFSDINEIVNEKKIDLDGETVNLEFFLGGDYKFILLMTGLSGATSHYACVWCKIHKDERWNMSYDLNHYNSPALQRTLKEMNELANKKTKQKYCCVNPPLLNIELDHVVLDELHLLLRIMDILIENLVNEALHWDVEDNWNKKKKEQKNIHLDQLKDTIRSCGVSFDIWEKTNADGKESGQYDFTSLLGPDKKKLLKELPEKLEGLIRPAAESGVKSLWVKFSIVYSIVTCKVPSDDMIANYFYKAKEWINLFVSLGDKCIGYKKANVTPYMHAMAYHVPTFLEAFKTVKIFTGQGVEKNDMARSIVLRKSNKWDGAGDVLRVESRQWELRNQERKKRAYNKKNTQYWEHELGEERKKKRKNST